MTTHFDRSNADGNTLTVGLGDHAVQVIALPHDRPVIVLDLGDDTLRAKLDGYIRTQNAATWAGTHVDPRRPVLSRASAAAQLLSAALDAAIDSPDSDLGSDHWGQVSDHIGGV